MKMKSKLILLLTTLLSCYTPLFGQVIFDFDNEGQELFGLSGESTNETSDGDILKEVIATIGDYSVIVSPKVETMPFNNRIWANAPKLRLYSGTCEILSNGSNIHTIVFYHRGRFNLTTNVGELTTDGNQTVWTGDAKEIIFKVNSNSQIDKISVNLPPSHKDLVNISVFADVKKVSEGDSVRLSLNNAQVLFSQSGYTYVQDSTAALLFYSMDIPCVAGQVLNGYIDCSAHLYNGQYELITNGATDLTTFSVSEGNDVVPEERSINEALSDTLWNHLVVLRGLTIRIDGTRYYGIKDNKEIQIFNRFGYDINVSEGSIADVTGILMPYRNTVEIFPTQTVSDASSINLKIFDDNGVDVTDRVSVVWYNVSGNQVGTGSILGGVTKGETIFYSLFLDETLGRLYKEVIKQKVEPSPDGTCVCNLERIDVITLRGNVQSYGIPIYKANVEVFQWLNKKYLTTTTALTNENGLFEIQVYNDSTEILISAKDYIDKKIVRRSLSNGELGTIDMEQVKGKVIEIKLSYQEAIRTGEAVNIQNWYSDTRNIAYSVRNMTKNVDVEDFSLQQGNIILPSGADNGDRILITAHSLNDKFSDAFAEASIETNDTAKVSLALVAYGGIEATCLSMRDDQLIAMIYDADEKLVMRSVFSTSRVTFANLKSGDYKLLMMGYNGAVGSIGSISELGAFGLMENVDYIINNVAVNDGQISTLTIADVPELDASKFEYTGENTYYLCDKSLMTVGKLVTLTTRVDFKEQFIKDIKNVNVVIDIPEGCEFEPNSVVVGTKALKYSQNGNKLIISLEKEDIDCRIRFCINPLQAGTYLTTSNVEFDCKGEKSQPIGQAVFTISSGKFFVPETTSTPNIKVRGIASPRATVDIYDGDYVIGTTVALSDGKWSSECVLHNAYNLSTHSIHAVCTGTDGKVTNTESLDCLYDINAIFVKSVTMINTYHTIADHAEKESRMTFDFVNLTTTPKSYSFWPKRPEFTFLIDLSENDTTKVSDVKLYVYTSDGDKRKLPAMYDGKLNCFVATSSFDMYSLPVNVTVNMHYHNYNEVDSLYHKDALNQLFSVSDVQVLEKKDKSILYKIVSHKKNFSIRCIYFKLSQAEEERVMTINNRMMFNEVEGTSSENRLFVSETGASQIIHQEQDSLFIFSYFDNNDTILCNSFWNLLCGSSMEQPKMVPKRAFYYDPYADKTPQSTDALNNWRDHIIRNAISAADKRLKCADGDGKIAINTAIKDLRQCVGFSIGSFLTYTINLGMSASGRPGNVIEGAHQTWETADAARGFGEGIDGLSARGRDCLNTIYSYPACNDDDDDDNNRKHTDDAEDKQDPSGYVYEAVPTNRIEGVKATVYYDNDGPIKWEAEEYSEINPQITDETGLYAWDVPRGNWKVVFEKEGYETTQTDWLPVPPPQLEVNIPMSQAVAPNVESAKGMESGITLDFSKYMKPNTLTKSKRVTVTVNGNNANGDIELLNAEENPYNNEEYVSKIRFVPNKSFKTTDEVIITVKKEVESYAGKKMTEDFVQRVEIESEITDIVCDSVMTVDYQGTGVLELSVLPAAAAKGRIVQVTSSSAMIAATDAQNVTLNDEGKASITVSGELPGNASLHLSMPEADKEKYVAVNVVTKEEEVVKTPKASKLSGSTMEDSYLLTLTCATKGATIYYTIDGSCPCDEQNRKKYTGPITLPEGQVTLQAIAVREGMADSDIATFNYTVIKDEDTGIKIIEESCDFEACYQDGFIVISGAKGASCHIYDLEGRELATRSRISNHARINVPKTDVYVISVTSANEQTVVHKIMSK